MADEHTGLGQIITSEKGRDAVHIAIAPVTAIEKLYPGQGIIFADNGNVRVKSSAGEEWTGIVDPFLTETVFPEQRFWMWMKPGSITSLRHEWTHPAFEISKTAKEVSEEWLRAFIATADCPEYETVMAAITGSALPAEHNDDYPTSVRWEREYLHFTGRDAHGEIPPEFWDHVEVVTGKTIQREMRSPYFSCSC